MRNRKTGQASRLAKTARCVVLLLAPFVAAAGCTPGEYLSKNMCNVFNCDTFFFIETLFPLSAPPTDGMGEGMKQKEATAAEVIFQS